HTKLATMRNRIDYLFRNLHRLAPAFREPYLRIHFVSALGYRRILKKPSRKQNVGFKFSVPMGILIYKRPDRLNEHMRTCEAEHTLYNASNSVNPNRLSTSRKEGVLSIYDRPGKI